MIKGLYINAGNIMFGLIGNIAITCSGVILPVINVVLHKKYRRLNLFDSTADNITS